jgi:hypothetical protein
MQATCLVYLNLDYRRREILTRFEQKQGRHNESLNVLPRIVNDVLTDAL